jgi:hypothetical protein
MAPVWAPHAEKKKMGASAMHTLEHWGVGCENGTRSMEGAAVRTGEARRGLAWGEGKKQHVGRALVDG